MSLEVKNLTKTFAGQKAVDNISFTVQPGEIVGFLGPNGAGKSTTMKILTTFLPPTEGKVQVGGFDVADQSVQVREIIGYLPEHNPLYLEMYVKEYLTFIGKLYDVKGNLLLSRVDEMIRLCGLGVEQHKKLESLSKGYRQRVGLAQALLHDPQILILDEPTSGLDPNQIVEIRKLIKQVSQHKTVLFSTHIMQEVQTLCSRVIIIHKGKIVADCQLDELLKSRGMKSLFIEFDQEVDLLKIKALPGVQSIDQSGPNQFRIFSVENADVRSIMFDFVKQQNISLMEMRVEESSLEEVFRELTTPDGEKIRL